VARVGDELQFGSRSSRLAAPLCDLVEQARVLDGNHRLIDEDRDQIDLRLGERLQWAHRVMVGVTHRSGIEGSCSQEAWTFGFATDDS
jgi:hypothetical protein